MKKNPYKKWDLHHHIIPPFYVEEMKKMGISVAGIKWPVWNAKKSLKLMNKFQIEKAFVSLSTPGVFFGDVSSSQNLNRKCNEYISTMIKEHPDRFGGFASVTLPDTTSALSEAQYALDVLKLDGIALMSNVNGHYLGDQSYQSFYEEMNNRNAIMYVHPNEIPGKSDQLFLNPLYLWQNDTTATIIDFIKSGYHRQFPNIRWIFSHGGGIIAPLFPSLIESFKKSNPNIVEELNIWKQQVFLDTASKAYDDQIPYLLNFSDLQHIVFGSDIGWGNAMAVSEVEKGYATLDTKCGLTEKQINGIFMDNAKRLFTSNATPHDITSTINYAKPDFGITSKVNAYHCHSEEEAISTINFGNYERAFISMDEPKIWKLEEVKRHEAIKNFNNSVANIRGKSPEKIGAFCSVDLSSTQWSIAEMDRAINDLHLDGICLTVDIHNNEFLEVLDEALIKKIGSFNKPVLIHPVCTEGIPLTSDNNLDTLYFIAKYFYLDIYKKYWLNTEFILTHTYDSLQYLSQPVGMLYYLSPKISTLSMFAYLWDAFILHKPKGYMILKNTITA